MKRKVSIILFLIIGFVFSQPDQYHVEYIHEQTGISFLNTALAHHIYIDNVYIDNFDAHLAEYDSETAPTGTSLAKKALFACSNALFIKKSMFIVVNSITKL